MHVILNRMDLLLECASINSIARATEAKQTAVLQQSTLPRKAEMHATDVNFQRNFKSSAAALIERRGMAEAHSERTDLFRSIVTERERELRREGGNPFLHMLMT